MINQNNASASRKKLYVGCSLTHASGEFVKKVEATKAALSKEWEVMEFLGVVKGTPRDVYEQDILVNVAGCDAFLGIADEPAWGLGFETARALDFGKPVLTVVQNDCTISRLALGVPDFEPNFSFRRYEDMVRDVPGIVREEFSSVLGSLSTAATLI